MAVMNLVLLLAQMDHFIVKTWGMNHPLCHHLGSMTEFVTAVMELMNLSLAQTVPTLAERWELQLVKKTNAGMTFKISHWLSELHLIPLLCYRFELESQGYAAKLQYINQGKQAKVGQEERAQALKAEQVEAEALRAEKEREKKEAEEPEKLALEKYQDKEVHEEEVKEPEEDPERVKREAEATQASSKS